MADHYVRPDVKAFLDFVNGLGAPPLSTLPLADARAGYLKMRGLAEADARALGTVRNLACPGPAGDIPLRLYDVREQRGPGPVLVFYHGGGFVIGDLESHDSLCRELAGELDLPVISVDYRLAPEHPFPGAPDDCEAATRWIAASPPELGRAVTGLVTIGDSAGGNLAIVTTRALMDDPAAVPVLLQVPIYPATDERGDHRSLKDFAQGYSLDIAAMRFFTRAYGGGEGNARAAPILGEHTGMPPTILVTASLDPIRDSGRAYGAALILAGCEVLFLEMTGTIHGFVNTRKALPSAQADLHRIVAAIRYMLENHA